MRAIKPGTFEIIYCDSVPQGFAPYTGPLLDAGAETEYVAIVEPPYVRAKTFDELAADSAARLRDDINAEAKRRIALLIPADKDTRERNQRRAARVAYERAKQPQGDLVEPYHTWEAQMIALDNAIEAIVTRSNATTTQADLDAWKAE